MNKKQLCPKCRVGAESIKLDEKSPVCPYMKYHNGERCARFEELRERELKVLEGI